MIAGNAVHLLDREVAVRFDSVSFSYGVVPVLENASFHVHRGEFIAMVGPNGSGKTTILKLLFGLETPDTGSIEIFGHVCTDATRMNREYNLAYVPQQPPSDQMFPITVRDVVRMGFLRPLGRYSRKISRAGNDSALADTANTAINDALEHAGIASLAARPYRSLSGGQKRRALVARALAAKPQFLVLDEPTANMDAESETRFYETLGFYKGKTTILIVTHDTEFVSSLTDRVLCLGDGSRSVVQHRIETHSSALHGAVSQDVRVLHGENIPDNECCSESGNDCGR
jgi:zinc transport system ATP-binding protein